jgi:hypothetical protein
MSFMGRRTFLSGYLPSVTVNGDITMGSGKAIIADATAGVRFSGHTSTTKIHGTTVDQIQVDRQGTAQITMGSTNALVGTTWTTTTGIQISAALRLVNSAVKTSDYTATSGDVVINMAVVAGGTLTMATTPAANQLHIICNASANPLTIARQSGATINGAAANPTIAAGAMALASWNATTSDWRIAEIAPA